jgi:Tripartite tricarboxylate transporter TctB family
LEPVRRNAPLKVRPQAIFSFLFFIFFIVFVYEAEGWRLQARLYPWAIGIPMLILALIQVILDWRGVESKSDSSGAPVDFQMSQDIDPAVAKHRAINIFSWIFGFFFLIWLFGFSIAIPAMVFGYLRIQSKEPWVLSIILTVAAWVVFWGLFVWLLTLPFPQGLIFEWLGIGS